MGLETKTRQSEEISSYEKLFEEGLCESDRLYNLGLTRFINSKAMKLEMSRATVEKLRTMLMKHHKSRLHKIQRVDRLKARVKEIKMLIKRY